VNQRFPLTLHGGLSGNPAIPGGIIDFFVDFTAQELRVDNAPIAQCRGQF
jgi:hypothetical protein